MNNRLLLGAAVEMSNAVGLKKNRLLSFCHGNLLVHQSLDTVQESVNLCLLLIVPVREKKKSTIDWNCCTWPQVSTLLLPSVTNLEHCRSFVVLDILLFLWQCLTPVENALVIKNNFSSSGLKVPEWLGLIFCWLVMFHDIIFPSHSEGCSAF